MANLVVHFEIHASEPQRLIDFYSELLGWRFTQFGDVPYWSIETGEGAVGNVAGTAGHGINGGLNERRGPRPDLGASGDGLQHRRRGRRCRRPDASRRRTRRHRRPSRPRTCRASVGSGTCSIPTTTSSASSRPSCPTAPPRWAAALSVRPGDLVTVTARWLEARHSRSPGRSSGRRCPPCATPRRIGAPRPPGPSGSADRRPLGTRPPR